ncbi:hypothetical protein PQR66_38450 [Paraburkholderia agricolaris]|uniref:Immunity protein 35 n=1 Tax=Paraburkholderia agricolaris TaxID=2152888 RepID=A0ABW9A1G8_9BURK
MKAEQAMTRTYEYLGYTLEVAIESDAGWWLVGSNVARVGYVAVVSIFQAEKTIAIFSPLRFGEAGGRPFATEADALMGGYSAARRIVEDLFSRESQ